MKRELLISAYPSVVECSARGEIGLGSGSELGIIRGSSCVLSGFVEVLQNKLAKRPWRKWRSYIFKYSPSEWKTNIRLFVLLKFRPHVFSRVSIFESGISTVCTRVLFVLTFFAFSGARKESLRDRIIFSSMCVQNPRDGR